MCCPHGQANEINPNGCRKVEGGLSYNPVFWDYNDKVFLDNWKKEKNFLLVGPKEGKEFECPKDSDGQPEMRAFWTNSSGNYRILMNGKLERQDIISMDETNETQKEIISWSSDNFCIVYTNLDFYSEAEIDTSDDGYSRYDFAFVTCHEDAKTPSPCEALLLTLHVTCLSI